MADTGGSGAVQGGEYWINHTIKDSIDSVNHSYTTPGDTTETNTAISKYRTVVMCGTPIWSTKYLLVKDIADSNNWFAYSDGELNVGYHHAEDYKNSLDKYGYIYKSQKFENADTASKLMDYAKDWIKNNYYGGITSFDITAVDMSLLDDAPNHEKYTIGKRVRVKYRDLRTKEMVTQTLSIISAEYDLQNPDKNRYKIGIPSASLNKVYGETSKSKSKGTTSSSQKGSETDTGVDTIDDLVDELTQDLDETNWARTMVNVLNGDNAFDLPSWLTPGEENPISNFLYGIRADGLKATAAKIKDGAVDYLTSLYLKATKGVDTDKLSSNTSNTGRTNAMTLDVVETAKAGTVEARTGDITADEGDIKATKGDIKATDGNITAKKTVSGKDVNASNNITATNSVSGNDVNATNNVSGKNGIFEALNMNNKEIKIELDNQGNPMLIFDGIKYQLNANIVP